MGHEIINDPATVKERAESKDGFATVDIPLLKTLRVLTMVKGQLEVNKKLASSTKDIQDFLQWATGNRKPPLPPIARRILCLKRAMIKNSVSYIQTGNLQRTGENKQLEEIDALLRADGVINLDDKEKCSTENITFVGGVSVNTPPVVEATPVMAAPSCGTTINCDNQAVVALLQEVKTVVDEINKKESSPVPIDNSDELKKVIEMKNEYIQKLLDILKNNKQNNVTGIKVSTNEVKVNEVQANEVKANEVQANEVKANEIQANEVQANEVKANEVKANEVQANEVKANEVQANEVQANEVQANEVKANEVKANEPIESPHKRLVLQNNNTYEPIVPTYTFEPNVPIKPEPTPPKLLGRKTKKINKTKPINEIAESPHKRLVLKNNNTYEPTVPTYTFEPNIPIKPEPTPPKLLGLSLIHIPSPRDRQKSRMPSSA